MVLDESERQRRRALVASVEEKVISLIDARPRHPKQIQLSELAAAYSKQHGEDLDLAELSQRVGLARTAELGDLLRGTYFPALAVRGSAKKGGVFVCHAASDSESDLLKAQALWLFATFFAAP